jgi:hypothetical protein
MHGQEEVELKAKEVLVECSVRSEEEWETGPEPMPKIHCLKSRFRPSPGKS